MLLFKNKKPKILKLNYICKQYAVEKVGDIDTVVDQLFIITTERRLQHPAIMAIVDATAKIFSGKL